MAMADEGGKVVRVLGLKVNVGPEVLEAKRGRETDGPLADQKPADQVALEDRCNEGRLSRCVWGKPS